MADAYLNIAERVLAVHRTPMRPSSIIRYAHQANLLPQHLFGDTPHKTLQARLSEDISAYGEKSRFFRTAPGVFFLRIFLSDQALPERHRTEYFARPRRKELRRDWVLTMETPVESHDTTTCKYIEIENVRKFISHGCYRYRPYTHAMGEKNTSVVHSFVVVYRDHRVLTYRTGRFSTASDFLIGQRSFGVGGAVLMDDADFLYESMQGIIENGIDELGYAVGLPRRLAERARYENELLAQTAITVPPSPKSPATIQIVLAYQCPTDFTPTKAALSVNDLRWIDPLKPGNTVDDYDVVSRLLIDTWQTSPLGSLISASAT